VNGKTWVLVSDTKGKKDAPERPVSLFVFPPIDYTPKYYDIGLESVHTADTIDYWGHYPILDMEYNTDAPIEVGLRAWAPFMPGDAVTSMMPGVVFDFRLHNSSPDHQECTLAFSWPGFELANEETAQYKVKRTELSDELTGVLVESGQKDTPHEMAYALAAANERSVRLGGSLNADGKLWADIASLLPETGQGETGSSLAVDLIIAPGETKDIRLLFAWHAPYWDSAGAPSPASTEPEFHTHVPDSNLFTHMYAKYFPNAYTTAKKLAAEADKLLKRVIAWQEEIYNDPDTPGWLADSLINIFHLIPETSIWGQAKEPIGTWCKEEDGLFGMNECPRGCPQIECIPCSFYGNVPIVYFFPEAALSTLRGYKAYQFKDGRPPWIFGGCTASVTKNRPPYELARPDKGYQTVLNAACYIDMADRYWQITGDEGFLSEFWDSLKRANDFSMNLRPEYGLSQVISMPTPGTDSHGLGDTEWFEAPEPGWKGYVTHAGGVRMAQVMIMRRMAEATKDEQYREKCDQWLKAGAAALEEHLWAGDYYLNFYEPETDSKSELVFGYQLDGQWMTDWHGLPGVFPKDRVDKTLETIRKFNCAHSQTGAVNYTNPDGSAAKVGGYGTYGYFPPELFMLAMTFMYEEQQEFGIDLLKRCLQNIVQWGYVWDFPNTVRGDKDTGERSFGADYYQNMMLWAVPSAIKGEDIASPCRPGGIIHKIIEVSKRSMT
ncbi:MAG: GH116 family glycosyl-hydrolase, partial [Anaerolineales bacterium]